ncbi:TetR/AcrR family transcriptional regulator, partial [Nocardia sp. NPDC004604]
ATRALETGAYEAGPRRPAAARSRYPPPRPAARAAQRYLVDILGNGVDLRARFQEALEVVVEAMATEEWEEKFRNDGWRAQARLEELGLGA